MQTDESVLEFIISGPKQPHHEQGSRNTGLAAPRNLCLSWFAPLWVQFLRPCLYFVDMDADTDWISWFPNPFFRFVLVLLCMWCSHDSHKTDNSSIVN